MSDQERARLARGFRIAVTGMDFRSSACAGLADYEWAIYAGTDVFTAQPPEHRNGKRPEETRLRQAVETAFADARLARGDRVGVVVVADEAAGLAGIPTRRARPLAALSGLSGPVFDLEDAAVGFEQAVALLSGQEVDAVVLGWISAGQAAAAALVLQRLADATANDARAYAVIEALISDSDHRASIITRAHEQAGIQAGQVGYVEVAADVDEAAAAALLQGYRPAGDELTCALGGGQSLALIPATVKAALCLYHRLIPESPELLGLSGEEQLSGSPFYLAGESQAWFQPDAQGPRRAAVHSDRTHLVLAASQTTRRRANRTLLGTDLLLFPLAGDNSEELLARLLALKESLLAGSQPRQAAAECYQSYQAQTGAQYAAVVLGHSIEETVREIEYAIKGIPAAFEKGRDWQTPLGSTFSPSPVGRQGSVAFVYPGAFNSYIGVGRELFYLFPDLHARLSDLTADIGEVMCAPVLYPRSRTRLSPETAAELEARLNSDPITMLKSGTTLSLLYTLILTETFGLEPGAAFGYSLGENSMMFAMGVWTNGDETSQRLSASDLFRTRLSGPQEAVRAAWGLPPGTSGDRLWSNYLVMARPERVYEALQSESRVYLTHVNTPRQVVIGGDPEACLRVIQSLGCSYLQAPFNHALHNEAMRSEMDVLIQMHDSPVVSVPRAKLYSAADYQEITIERSAIAENIGRMLCNCLDFPRLVEQVYSGGARIFIELGAGSNCAKWVDEILVNRPHAAIGINRRGVDDLTLIARTLAKLCAHRVAVDLSPLYENKPSGWSALAQSASRRIEVN